MNIFVLDLDPVKCAQYHVDQHVRKMILESAQLLTYAIHLHPPRNVPDGLYRGSASHSNHPCAKWVRESLSNYRWLVDLARCLNRENQWRNSHDKEHKSWTYISVLGEPRIHDIGLTPFAQAMPDWCCDPDPVTAYRNYYVAEKSTMWSWKRRGAPDWLLPHHRLMCNLMSS